MAIKHKLRQLERAARESLDWITLEDGSFYYYDPERTYSVLFLYAANSLRAGRRGEALPDPPEILEVIGGLPTPEDRERAFWKVYGRATKPFVTYDAEKYFASGEIVPYSRLACKPPGQEPPDEGGGGAVRIGKPPDHLR